MSILKILEEDSSLPLDIEEVKLFLKVDYDDEDSLILRSLKTAIKQCEFTIGQSIIPKKYLYSLYEKDDIKLLYGPVENIEKVSLITNDNKELEINSTFYFLDRVNSNIIFYNKLQNYYRLDIIYNTRNDSINDDIKNAILIHTAKIFEDRLGYSSIPQASLQIYKNYRIKKL